MTSSSGRQIPLDLPHDASLARVDFLISPANATAIATIDAWPDWPSPTLVIAGPAGSGKSHLVSIWAERSSARVLPASAVSADAVEPAVSAGAVAVEDLDRGGFDETALFHLLNRAREASVHLVMTSRVWPAALPVALPDLKSRLVAANTIEIGEPDDDLLRAVLAKLFADRQLDVAMPVIEFIVRRMERSLDAALDIVAELDRRALSERRAITRPLAQEVLAERGDAAPGG